MVYVTNIFNVRAMTVFRVRIAVSACAHSEMLGMIWLIRSVCLPIRESGMRLRREDDDDDDGGAGDDDGGAGGGGSDANKDE